MAVLVSCLNCSYVKKLYLRFFFSILKTAIQSSIDVNFERSIGFQENDWTVGYYGSLYQAEIVASNEPYTIGWTYNGQALIYNIGVANNSVETRDMNGLYKYRFFILSLSKFKFLNFLKL